MKKPKPKNQTQQLSGPSVDVSLSQLLINLSLLVGDARQLIQQTKEKEMPRTLPNPGSYTARRTGPIVVRETDRHALCAYIPLTLCNSEVNWAGKAVVTLGKQDGTLQVNAIANFGKIWPSWDRTDFFALEEIPIPDGDGPEFEVTDCVIEQFDPGDGTGERDVFKIGWVNPLGGSVAMPEPVAAADRKNLIAKWSSKFKANAGGTKVKPAESKPATAPAASGPPKRTPPTRSKEPRMSNGDEVWELLTKANPKENQDKLMDKYYETVNGIHPGGEDNIKAVSPEEWGEIADKLGV